MSHDAIQAALRLGQHLRSGQSLKSLLPGQDRNWEAIYFLAHRLYGFGRYENAGKAFAFLCNCVPEEERYWLALGMTLQKLGDYTEAADAFIAGVTRGNSRNPWLALHTAECFVKTERYQDALKSLEIGERWAKPHPDGKIIAARVQGLRKTIGKRLERLEAN